MDQFEEFVNDCDWEAVLYGEFVNGAMFEKKIIIEEDYNLDSNKNVRKHRNPEKFLGSEEIAHSYLAVG